MSVRAEVLQRLLLAKSILSVGRAAPWGQPNAHLVARLVLNAHDAADLAFAAIADHQGKLPAKGQAPTMMECLNRIDSSTSKYEAYFKQLNDARNGLKHVGNLPNIGQWAGVADDVFVKLSDLCMTTINVSLEDIDESELLENGESKTHFAAAKVARSARDFKLALEEVAKALYVSLDQADVLEGIRVGRARAEDALKLTAFGVPANDFLRLQEFLPIVSVTPTGSEEILEISDVLWRQSEFGHPGNWREDVTDFCLATFLTVAIAIQGVSPVPFPREFSMLYDYKITVIVDGTELWEDLLEDDEHLAQVYANDARPFRVTKRFLNTGESIVVSGHTKPFVSDDRSLSGESIQRVRVSSMETLEALFGSGRAEFVDHANVQITCVPTGLAKHYFPDLTEIPWQADPLAFSL